MTSWNKAGMARVALATALLIAAGASHSLAAPNTKSEGKCQTTMAKMIGKHAVAINKAMTKCMANLFDGGPACPDADVTAALDKSAAKVSKTVDKKCQSACSISEVPCIGSPFCPPNGVLTENCTAAGKNFFESEAMGFPGSLCEGVIGTDMVDPEHFGLCSAGVGELVSDALFNNIYGDLNGTPALSDDAEDCLKTIAKQIPKAASKMASTVAKCRNTQLTKDPATVLPDDCRTGDVKTSDKVDKFRDKALAKVADKCTDAAVSELSLCGAGTGGLTLVTEATDCLGTLLDEASFSNDPADTRTFASTGIINGAYPDTAPARCGDNVINQAPSQFLLLGEECDGTDLGTCASCTPPGDLFECTCAEKRRTRTFADGFNADLDNGWSGSSHNAAVTDGSGFLSDISNCDCDAFTDNTCTGTTGDSVCDLFAELKPRCSHRIGDGTTCDEVGNQNNANNDQDCQTCDAFAGNSGDYCTGTARTCLGGTCTSGAKTGSTCVVNKDCGTCVGGLNNNQACLLDSDCSGGTCSVGTCTTGGTSGDRCNVSSDDCPSGSCEGSGVCLAGPFAGDGCDGPQHCGVCLGGVNVGQHCSVPANCPGSSCDTYACVSDFCLGGSNDTGACLTDGDCPGGRCAETSDCESQCYDEADVAQGPCWRQSDCATGERCRGVCDTTNTCVITRNGSPLPLSAEGTSVCIDSQFFTNMTGTRDIVTGEHEINYDLRSVTILANEINSSPCPVCGGWCAEVGSQLDRFRCSGSCTGPELECRYGANIGDTCVTNADCDDQLCGAVACRFDEDCPSGTCDGTGSPDCLGELCRLDLACSIGPNEDQPCRIEAATAFGTTSADCPPDPSTNVSGTGLAISWTPLTSGTITAESPAPCDSSGFENYDCNCVTGGGGTRNQPNRCQSACNAGANYGAGCNDFTVCVGGAEAGAACDEDSDCSGGGTCTGNPRVCGTGNVGECSVHSCVGGVNDGDPCASTPQCPGGTCPLSTPCTIGGAACTYGECVPDVCTTNADCEIAVTCDDACPGGLCTPLCVQTGNCSGGPKDGLRCALDVDCLGGTCVPGDPEEGACAKGAFNHCDGPGWEFVSCAPLQVGTQEGCEFGTDAIGGNANDNIGAGFCVADVTNCVLNSGFAEGGSTLNGNGDPTNSYSVAAYCIPASTNSAVNATAGLPGPGRIRLPAVTVPNFSSMP